MFTIYSRTVCSGCETAKTFLTQENEDYIVKNIETDLDARKEFQTYFPTARSVPMIICNEFDNETVKLTSLEQLYTFVKGN